VHRLLRVDEDILVVFGVVGCACRDVQHILLRVGYFGHCYYLTRKVGRDRFKRRMLFRTRGVDALLE
jgi:hypothetical protein